MIHPRWEAVILSSDWEWRHSVARTLDANGIDYAHAASIEACKELVAAETVGLIFWDSHLAERTYQDFADSIRMLDTRVKIVVVSHADDWEWHRPAARERAFGVVPFPCQPTDIEWLLSRVARAEFHEARPTQVRELQTHF